ncbi:MAG: hypothetical protein U0401_17195 [Anaerolineae bacterium]
MTATQLLTSVSYVVDEAGHRKAVQLDLTVWEEIKALVEAHLRMERVQAYEHYYAPRCVQDEAEELELLADFAPIEAEIVDEM